MIAFEDDDEVLKESLRRGAQILSRLNYYSKEEAGIIDNNHLNRSQKIGRKNDQTSWIA